jgi:phage terminase large subunit-like protein
MQWTTACPDWEDRILSGRSLVPCPPLFPNEAAAALDVFKRLRIVDAPGSPTMGEACRPWVFDFVAAVFGAYDAESARRLINDFFLLISKKNSKSTIAAGIMVTALIRNWRMSAEFIILAPTIEVANNSAKPAMDMVRADPDLEVLLRPIPHQRTIEHRTTGATLKIVAADSDVVSGKKASGILIDEVWLFGKRPNAENMLREATGGLASRPEGFVIGLSTQSDDPPAGVFKQTLDRFRDIRDGKIIAPRSMGVMYEFPKAMVDSGAYRKPANFYVTNPNLGASVDEQFLLDELAKAESIGPDSLNGFLAKHLNVEIGINLRSDRWNGADHWEATTDPTLTLDSLIERCEVLTVGIDNGGLDDLLGLAVLGRDKIDRKRWYAWGRAWCHCIALKRRQSEAARLHDFERTGDLTIVDDLIEAVEEAADMTAAILASGKLAGVGLDQIGIGAIVDILAERGIISAAASADEPGARILAGISQGYKLKGAIYTAEIMLANGTLRHADQPLMTWAVGNARAEVKGNSVLITKALSGVGKIDPLMALLNAVTLMSDNPKAPVTDINDMIEQIGGF